MKRRIIAGIVIATVLVSLIAGLMIKVDRDSEVSYRGGGAAVGIISISGTIVCSQGGTGLWGGRETSSENVIASLRKAATRPDIRAVVLRLNSPGGTAAGAQEIALEIDRLRQAGKKVVASMGDVSASGAYWIACRTDKIVANPGTLTGSIGVIMQTADLRGLYQKLGIGTEKFKSGAHKDMGSPDRPITPEERAIFQGMVEDIYEQFLQTVAEGRKMDLENVRKLSDGRVFTGRQAYQAGLVDELGNLRTAINLAARLAGLKAEPRIIELGPQPSLWQQLFGSTTNLQMVLWETQVNKAFPAVWLLVP